MRPLLIEPRVLPHPCPLPPPEGFSRGGAGARASARFTARKPATFIAMRTHHLVCPLKRHKCRAPSVITRVGLKIRGIASASFRQRERAVVRENASSYPRTSKTEHGFRENNRPGDFQIGRQ